MKRFILFTVLIFAGHSASAQQNVNDSLKNERLYKLLERLKVEVLNELAAVDKSRDYDSIATHFERIETLCASGMFAITNPANSADGLEKVLNTPDIPKIFFYAERRPGELNGTLLESLREIALTVRKNEVPKRIRKELSQLVPLLEDAVIIY